MVMRATLSLVALLVTAKAFASDWPQSNLWESEGRLGDNGAVVLWGKWLLVLTSGGELLVLEADAQSFSETRRYAVAETPTWAHPVPTASGILVKDEFSLALWKLTP